MAKHTPGPWEADGPHPTNEYSIIGQAQGEHVLPPLVAHVSAWAGLNYEPDIVEARANRDLIIAAPDLLQACRAFLNPTGHTDACTELRAFAVNTGQLESLTAEGGPCANPCRQARMAIAKATGEEVR